LSNTTRGTVLAGRYRLEDRQHATTDSSVWRAADLTLDRAVTVRVMRPGHPYSADVADAARRVSLIDDPRLVRVLDVGKDQDTTFVVTSHVDGDNLAALIERAPLAPQVVRRIVGEVAQGLRGAAARGLHHLRLNPRAVIICYDNTVKIAGVAVEAAAAGLDPAGATAAARVDAVGLIGLLYAGLTGRWPLGDPGFAAAPRARDGGPIAPTELIPDIPGDLNRLCVLTLGPLDSGPHSPAEVVGVLAPWPTADEAPLRSASRPRDPATPITPNPALVIRGRSAQGSSRGHTDSREQPYGSGFRPGGPVAGPAAGRSLAPESRPFPTARPVVARPPTDPDDPERTVAARSAADGPSLFEPRPGPTPSADPDVTRPVPGGLFAALTRDPAQPHSASEDPGPAPARPSAWPSGATVAGSGRTQGADDGRPPRPSQAGPRSAAHAPARPTPNAASAAQVRRTASLFPTPSVAITGSMPLPPRAKSGDRTDAMFGDPGPQQAATQPDAPQPQQPGPAQQQPRRPATPPLEAAPSPWSSAGGRADSRSADPRFAGRPFSRPVARGQHPEVATTDAAPTRSQAPAAAGSVGNETAEHGPDSQQVRRTASIFPTPSVAMTGSMPLPPRAKGNKRTEALFGDIEPAVDTQITPVVTGPDAPAPARATRAARPAQFAQPPRTHPGADEPRSGPIPTASAARTAAGLRAGRPASRPIERDPDDRAPEVTRAEPVPGSPPYLFASAAQTGPDAPDPGVAPEKPTGQHAGMGSERAAGPGRHRGPIPGRPSPDGARAQWSNGWPPGVHTGEPPSPLDSSGPFPIVIPQDAPSRDQSRKVLIGIFGVFLILLLFAFWSLRGLFLGSDDSVSLREQGPVITNDAAGGAATTAAPSAAAPATTAPATTTTTTTTAAAVRIRTATALDPLGDGDEDSAAAPLAVDGDKSTSWETDRYETAAFGGLKKGLGLAIELRQAAALSSARIDVAGTGGRVQLRTADAAQYDGSTTVGSGAFSNGTVTINAKDGVGKAKYVILWFTELPATDGGYRLEVSEVRLT